MPNVFMLIKAVKAKPVVLFMKGTPDSPQCGFSRAVVQVLDIHGVPREKMQTYNVLEDAELRSGIKEYSCVTSMEYISRNI
jgi:monothiol glutaredoxin